MKVMIDPYLLRHRKLRRLARNLRVGVPAAMGYLLHGWCDTMLQSETGVLEGYTEGEVTQAFGYKGDPTRFIEAITDAGFLEKKDDTFIIHQWPEHQGDILDKRAQWRDRKRKQREKDKGVTRDSHAGHPIPSLPSHPLPIPSIPGGEVTPQDEVIRQLLQKARMRKIPNREDTLRRNIEAWGAKVGFEKVDEVLSDSKINGWDVLEINDAYFRKNGHGRDVKKSVRDWIDKDEKKSNSKAQA